MQGNKFWEYGWGEVVGYLLLVGWLLFVSSKSRTAVVGSGSWQRQDAVGQFERSREQRQ